MARRSSRGARHMAWVRSFKKNSRRRSRRRGYRRNPYAMAGPVAAALNPRRRRRARRNPARRRSYRRNPVKLFGLPPIMQVAYAGAGFVGTAAADSLLTSYLPLEITGNMLGKYAVKIGSVLGVSMLARTVLGRQAGYLASIGGGIYVLTSAVKDFAPGVIPGLGQPLNLAAYRTGRGMGQPLNLAAYRQSRRQLGSPVFGAANTSATSGTTNVVASRFRRFQ